MNTPQVNITVTDDSASPAISQEGILFLEGKCTRGPISDPSILITSWNHFRRIFGDYVVGGPDFPLLVKRALDKGCLARINRVAHYTTISTPSSLTAVKATLASLANVAPENLFTLTAKYHGADYNNLIITIAAASNGQSSYFNLTITHATDTTINEVYRNLKITGGTSGRPTVDESTYLTDIINGSEVVDVTYIDLSGSAGTMRPLNGTYLFSTTGLGSDGGTVVTADYVGDATARNGFHAFDAYNDSMIIAAPELSDSTTHIAGEAYAEGRGDLVYFAHLANSLITAATLASAKDANTSSTWVAYFAGGLKIYDPTTSQIKNISELGDILGLYSQSHQKNGPWYSVANVNRGKINNCIGPVTNFGGPGSKADMNILANHQINLAINRNKENVIWGNFTGQLQTTLLSFLNVKFLVLKIQKDLAPVLESFLEEPLDIPSFQKLYSQVRPYFDDLKSVDKRALYKYEWQGDQDAKDMDHLVVNDNSNDLAQGKYKIKLAIAPIPGIQDIELGITVSKIDGVAFTINE